MRITWEVEDGYVDKARPQYTEVSDEELAECKTDAERAALIEDCVREDFEQRISFGIVTPI